MTKIRMINTGTRFLSLLLIFAAFFVYQKAAVREAEARQAERERKIVEQRGPYTDGVYTGTGTGFGGDIVLEFTIEGGYIADIREVSHDGEDEAFYEQARTILSDIFYDGTEGVDTVTGATFSSSGILAAAEDALKKAVAGDE